MRRFFYIPLLLTLFFFGAYDASAAIAYDAASGVNSSGTSLTLSHTTSGSNRILLVGIWNDGSRTISSITYNSVAMTLIATTIPGTFRYSLYYLVAPATGTNDIAITFSGSASYNVIGVSYTGAKQTGQPDASAANAVFGVSSVTVSPVVVAANSWAVAFGRGLGSPTFTVGPTTERSGAGQSRMADSNGSISTASYTSTIEASSAGETGNITASIAAAPDTTSSFGIFFPY